MKKIIIADNGEPLVQIKKYCPGVLLRQYEKGGTSRINNLKVRKSVARMLGQAQSFLPRDIHLMVRDAWRPVAVQRQLFLNWRNRIQRLNPDWSAVKVNKVASNYAVPSESKIPSGHLTGGAVDVTLCYNAKLRLPMKTKKVSFKEQTSTKAYKKLPPKIAQNRKILYQAMSQAGFSNLSREWWHFSFGDWWWAKRTGAKKTHYNKIVK